MTPVCVSNAATAYDWTLEPRKLDPQRVAVLAASLESTNSFLVSDFMALL